MANVRVQRMRALRASVAVLALGVLAASSSSHSVFVLTFERPTPDVAREKDTIQRLARLPTPPGGFMAMEVIALDPARFEVSYLQGRPGCSNIPEVDGAANAIDSTKKQLEAEYGPLRIEQRHRANSGAVAP